MFSMSQAGKLIKRNIDNQHIHLILNNYGIDGTEEEFEWLIEANHLMSLDLGSNNITNTEFLYGLNNLKMLYLESNQIEDIDSIKQLSNLEHLELSSNQIEDISSIAFLTYLEFLSLGNNKIIEIFPLTSLKNLTYLNLSHNQVQNISLDFLNSFPKLEGLFLFGNPIKNIPTEIFDKKRNILEDVRNYLEQQAKEQTPSYLWEGKMILVGNGEVGKSSIRKKLLDKNATLPKEEDRTKGIDLAIDTYAVPVVSPMQMTNDSSQDFQLHIWDFGGQGRYREVQQLFCSRKSLYLFVTAYDDQPNQEDYVGFEYWLSMVNAFNYDPDAKRHSPVIHVLNKIDQETAANFNEAERRALFPNIQAFCKVSALNLQNFEALEEAIQTTLPLVSEDVFTTAFPKTWLDIKEELENQAKQGINHILWQDYLAICAKKEVNESAASTLIRTLDRMGYVIYYGNHSQLKNWIILNPLWVKDAIYRVLDSERIREAKFYPNDFDLVWDEYETRTLEEGIKTLGEKWKYTQEEHKQFLNLMLAYEFCYAQKDNRGNSYYIIPALFEQKPPLPDNLENFDYEVKFEYNPFIPAGTVNKLIVRLNESIHRDLHWKNGAIFMDDSHFAFAEVQEVWEEKTVYLKLKGQTIKPLYNLIYQTLLDLNQQLKETKFLKTLNFKTWVKYKGSWLSLKEVINFEIKDYEFVLRGSLDKEGKDKSVKNRLFKKDELLELLNEYELAALFKALNDLEIKSPHLGKLKKEYKLGKDNADFLDRLELFINDLEID